MQVVFKNCGPFEKCRTEINETFINEVDVINITMPMYNLIALCQLFFYFRKSLAIWKR